MSAHPFYKISASGNTTLFLPTRDVDAAKRTLLSVAMGPQGVEAEQAAFADVEKGRVEMAGGEFCANACRAMGALLDLHNSAAAHEAERKYQISISGMDSPVDLVAKGFAPVWEISAAFRLPPLIWEKDGCLCHLPGISHLLIETEELPGPEEAAGQAAKLSQECCAKQPAHGFVWWRKAGGVLELLPYVIVPSAGTAMVESACGSASMALAFALHAREGREIFAIAQPSGEKLFCQLENGRITLGGKVTLCAAGKLWL